MKCTIPEYAITLSNNDFSILEDIFENKYKKFIEVFFIISNHSDYIEKLTYFKTKKEKLKICVDVKKSKVEKVYEKILEKISDKKNISVKNNDNEIHIEIKDVSKTVESVA
jgi:hypothetical protein